MIVGRETLFDVADEIDALLLEHYEELTHQKLKIKLKPMWGKYAELERAGKLFIFTAREAHKLVGYSAFFLAPHPHYEDTLVAQNDVLFLTKTARLGMSGVRLIKFSEESMRAAGAHKITWHVKFTNDFRPILHRLGYLDEEVMCGKMF